MKKSKFVALFYFPPPDITLKSVFLGGWEHEQSEFVAHVFPRHEFQKSVFLGGCEHEKSTFVALLTCFSRI